MTPKPGPFEKKENSRVAIFAMGRRFSDEMK
jgi:hypothetical protein